MKNKKAQQTIGNLPSSIIAIVVAIIILVLGVVILQEIRDVPMVAQGESTSYFNTTLTTVNEAGEYMCPRPGAVCSPVTAVWNESSLDAVPVGNYSQTNCLLAYSGATVEDGLNNTNWNYTVSCTYGGVSYTTGNASLVGVGNFSDFIPIIIIALAASIVIGLILLGFLGRKTQR